MKIIPFRKKELKEYLTPLQQDRLEIGQLHTPMALQRDFIEDVYYALLGDLENEDGIEGVENAFAPGSLCEQLYEQVFYANMRISARLKQEDEDSDVCLIINNMLSIEYILCYKMYLLGAKYGLPTDGMPRAPSNIAKKTMQENHSTILPFQ